MGDCDEVFLWQAGKQSGIYGVGVLVGRAYQVKNDVWRVDLKYTKHFEQPILRSTLLRNPALKNLDVIKRPFAGTNFSVTHKQREALKSIQKATEQDCFAIQSQFQEGALRRVLTNVYERRPEARRECLQHYGYDCCVCGFNFEKIYGEHGEGFIHVHHLKQLAKSKKQHKVKPILHLRPICPNCHAMIHKGPKMLKVEGLKSLLRQNKRKN